MTMGQPATFVVDRHIDGVAVVTANRPEAMNSISFDFIRELPEILLRFDRDDAIRACVITGSGRAFSAGGDIKSFSQLQSTAQRRQFLTGAFHMLETIEEIGMPVIAAVNGLALGGGTELVLACDMALASATASFGMPEVTLGLIPAFGLLRAPGVIGRSWTRYLAMSGRTIDAITAERIGLVQGVVPHDTLLHDAVQLAVTIAKYPPTGVQLAKKFSVGDSGLAAAAGSLEGGAFLLSTSEHHAAAKAYLQAHPTRTQPDDEHTG
jgi:enoyl-CoA hydratase/carnithine racemase